MLIEYHLEKESGPAHAKLYTVRLRLGEKDYLGEDRSIKLAQRAAAQTALQDQEQSLPTSDCVLQRNGRFLLIGTRDEHSNDWFFSVAQPATVVLNSWAARHQIPTRYVELQEPTSSSRIFYYRFHVGENLYFDGQGPSRAQARLDCANKAWIFLLENPMSIMVIPSPTPAQVNFFPNFQQRIAARFLLDARQISYFHAVRTCPATWFACSDDRWC